MEVMQLPQAPVAPNPDQLAQGAHDQNVPYDHGAFDAIQRGYNDMPNPENLNPNSSTEDVRAFVGNVLLAVASSRGIEGTGISAQLRADEARYRAAWSAAQQEQLHSQLREEDKKKTKKRKDLDLAA